MSNELKPCPFCGGVAVMNCNNFHANVNCSKCGVAQCFSTRVQDDKSKDDAAEAWNIRTPAPVPTSGAVEVVKALNKKYKAGDSIELVGMPGWFVQAEVNRGEEDHDPYWMIYGPSDGKSVYGTDTLLELALLHNALAAQPPAADGKLREALEAVQEHFTLVDADGERAKCFNGSAQTAGEDAAVLALCKGYGFGAVMDSAARQWYAKDPAGAFVIGSCAGLVRPLKAQVDAALAQPASGQNKQENKM